MPQQDIKKHFEEHGWVLIKGLFSKEEVMQWRKDLRRTIDEGFKGDILSNPYLHPVIYDDRIVKVLREVLGDTPVYFGDGGYLWNNNQWGLHKDVPDREDPKAPDWQSPYTVLRTGIYLQDTSHSSGGLLLRDKSHNTISINEGRSFNVPLEVGDYVIWNLRTTHSGHAKLFRIFSGFMINPKYYRLIPNFLFVPDKTERAAMFITYGKQDKHLERYLKYLVSRTTGVQYLQNSIYDPKVLAEAEKHGLKVINMRTEEVMKLKPENLNMHHKDIPY